MSNFQVHKGISAIIGVSLTDYDGNPDSTTPIQVSSSGFGFNLTPIAAATAGQRLFRVEVPASATTSGTGSIFLAADIPATGSGAGGAVYHNFVTHLLDAVVPVDHRSLTAIPPTTE